MNIREWYQLRTYKGDVGIEIEVEGKDLPREARKWRVEHDGSLRGEAFEYVTRNGVKKDDIRETIKVLEDAFKASVVNDSARAGVHVHVNVQDMTHTQLASFAVLYYILENLLTRWCGGHREGNLFCLRADDADYVLDCVQAAYHGTNLRHTQTDMVRYSAMNWKPVTTYGSLEFRQMRTPKDFALVSKWAQMLLTVKEASLRYKEPRDIISEWSMSTPEDFLDDHMGAFAGALRCGGFADMMLKGMFNAQDVAFCVDWDGYENNFQNAIEDENEFYIDEVEELPPPQPIAEPDVGDQLAAGMRRGAQIDNNLRPKNVRVGGLAGIEQNRRERNQEAMDKIRERILKPNKMKRVIFDEQNNKWDILENDDF